MYTNIKKKTCHSAAGVIFWTLGFTHSRKETCWSQEKSPTIEQAVGNCTARSDGEPFVRGFEWSTVSNILEEERRRNT